MTYEPMTDEGRANVEGIVEKLAELGDHLGDYTAKYDCRQQSLSVHLKFEHRAGPSVTADFAGLLVRCPELLADACRKLLAADEALRSGEAAGG